MVLGRAASPRAGLQHAKRARTWQPGPGDVKLEQSIAQDLLSATSVASPPWPSVIAESLVPKGFFDEPDPFDELYAMDPEDIHLSYGRAGILWAMRSMTVGWSRRHRSPAPTSPSAFAR